MKAAIPFIMIAALSGCASPPQEPAIADTMGRYVFDYTMQGARAARVVQVFDDGAKTYVQFTGLRELVPLIKSGQGGDLAFERDGPFAVISGVHGRLLITVAGATADITNNRAVRSATSGQLQADLGVGTDEAGMPDGQAAQLQRLQTELQQARGEIALLKARDSRTSTASRYVVRFADNSSAVNINADTLAELADLAAHVRCLTITGFTDATQLTPGGSRLAMRRAFAVRKLLQERGIDAAKVQVRFFGAGKFTADNSTAEGKAANRRVEIQVGEEAAA